jgi:DNA-binding LacI/PurR family transcriptional regulator
MVACGISDRLRTVIEGDHKIDGGAVAMGHLLSLPHPPTAVLTSNDLTAIGVLRAIDLAGLRVPEDISVAGFEDIELSQSTYPPLTTIRLSRDELGRAAFDALYRTVKGVRRHTAPRINISTRRMLRKSTARGRRA